MDKNLLIIGYIVLSTIALIGAAVFNLWIMYQDGLILVDFKKKREWKATLKFIAKIKEVNHHEI